MQKIIFLVGPTAIGKSDIACELAKKINAEIISCDSMQIYKGLRLITSKPTLSLRKKVKHHLIDIIAPCKEYNVFQYRKAALKSVRDILSKGKVPLFVGGTGLYMSILIDGIFSQDTKNKTIRKRLYSQAQKYGNRYLYKRLQNIDPEAALKIHPNDTKRVIRALEVFESCGKPISYFQRQRDGLAKDYDVKIFCLNMEREALNKRIDERVEKMFCKGLVTEVQRLLKTRLGKTAAFAIGIKELKGYICGLYDLEEAKRLIKHNTRSYAKRQLTWFRKDKRVKWVEVADKEKPKKVADRILSFVTGK
jgi:tRNA dimethylallyltransferase